MTTAAENTMAEWMSRSRKVVQVWSQASTEAGSVSVLSIPASAGLEDGLNGVSENTTTVTGEENFEREYARSWSRIESDSDVSFSEYLGLGVVDRGDYHYGEFCPLSKYRNTSLCKDANAGINSGHCGRSGEGCNLPAFQCSLLID